MSIARATSVQFQLMLFSRDFKFSISFMLGFSLLSYMYAVLLNMNVDISQMLSYTSLFMGNHLFFPWAIFSLLFPFVIVFPFAFSFQQDTKLNTFPYFMRRFGKKTYFSAKYITTFLGGGLVIFFPFLLNLLLCYFTFPDNNNTEFGLGYISYLFGTNVLRDTLYQAQPFAWFFLKHKLIYCFLHIILISILSGTMSMFALSWSYYIRRKKLLLFLPIYVLIYLGTFIDTFLFDTESIPYVNVNILSYMSIHSMYGKSMLFFLAYIFMLMICNFTIYRKFNSHEYSF
jgi:hypothetical protein